MAETYEKSGEKILITPAESVVEEYSLDEAQGHVNAAKQAILLAAKMGDAAAKRLNLWEPRLEAAKNHGLKTKKEIALEERAEKALGRISESTTAKP